MVQLLNLVAESSDPLTFLSNNLSQYTSIWDIRTDISLLDYIILLDTFEPLTDINTYNFEEFIPLILKRLTHTNHEKYINYLLKYEHITPMLLIDIFIKNNLFSYARYTVLSTNTQYYTSDPKFYNDAYFTFVITCLPDQFCILSNWDIAIDYVDNLACFTKYYNNTSRIANNSTIERKLFMLGNVNILKHLDLKCNMEPLLVKHYIRSNNLECLKYLGHSIKIDYTHILLAIKCEFLPIIHYLLYEFDDMFSSKYLESAIKTNNTHIIRWVLNTLVNPTSKVFTFSNPWCTYKLPLSVCQALITYMISFSNDEQLAIFITEYSLCIKLSKTNLTRLLLDHKRFKSLPNDVKLSKTQILVLDTYELTSRYISTNNQSFNLFQKYIQNEWEIPLELANKYGSTDDYWVVKYAMKINDFNMFSQYYNEECDLTNEYKSCTNLDIILRLIDKYGYNHNHLELLVSTNNERYIVLEWRYRHAIINTLREYNINTDSYIEKFNNIHIPNPL